MSEPDYVPSNNCTCGYLNAYEEYMDQEKFIADNPQPLYTEEEAEEADLLADEELETAKEFNSLCKKVDSSRLTDCIKVGFVDIAHHTSKAILFELYNPTTGEVYEQWIPKGVCSNLHYIGKHVHVWNNFAKDQLKDWYEEPLK